MTESPTKFLVSVGHISVHVQAESKEAAIEEARRKMCAEMPRLWDVISSLEDSRFDVQPQRPSDERDVA